MVPVRSVAIGEALTMTSAANVPAAILRNSINTMAGQSLISPLHDPEMIHHDATPQPRERSRIGQALAGRTGNGERHVPFAALAQTGKRRPVFDKNAAVHPPGHT